MAFEILGDVEMEDIALDPLDLAGGLFFFITPPTGPSMITAPRQGGIQVSLVVNVFGTVTEGQYIVHIGPLGSAADPICYNGIPGSGGKIVNMVDVGNDFLQSEVPVWLPPNPIGGPYTFFLEQVSGGPVGGGTQSTAQIVAQEYSNKCFQLRRMLPSQWAVGERNNQLARFPQK